LTHKRKPSSDDRKREQKQGPSTVQHIKIGKEAYRSEKALIKKKTNGGSSNNSQEKEGVVYRL